LGDSSYNNALAEVKKLRFASVIVWLLTVLAVQAVTPDIGKDKLRKLVKLPTITFQPDWTFDPERGFALGSKTQDVRAQIVALRSGLKGDLGDADDEEKLGELCASIGEDQNAENVWTRAAEHYRKRVESQPDEGLLLAGFGLSLEGAGKLSEAESVLRQAVRVAPNEWRCRVALGRYLDHEARRNVLEGVLADPASDKPAAGEVSLALKRMDEAGDCFDRATTMASDEPEVWFRRGMHRCLRQMVLNQIRLATGGDEGMADVFEGCFSPETLADLQHASRLSPADYELIGATALFEVYTITGRKGQTGPASFSWDALPEKSQESLRAAMTRLENLAQSGDPGPAAGALETLGILEGPVLHEPNRCIASLRQALAIQPSREHAWEVLVATLAQGARYDELLAVCEDHVKQTNSARTHLLLAKAHEKLQQWDDSEDEARIAAGEDPGDFSADLALAALLLKRSGNDDSALSEADEWLKRSEAALNKTPPPLRNREQVIDLTLTRGIYFALTDEMDTARQFVKTVIERDKDNKFAREILSAMDF
jgi:tetratricopeptide (TPR) repeat protein